MARSIALVHGLYYVVTGALPIVSMSLFEMVTGDKTDEWLVLMVALLTLAIGVTLLQAARAASLMSARVLGITSASAFAAMDVWVLVQRAGTTAYGADLVVELCLIAGWLASRSRRPLAGG